MVHQKVRTQVLTKDLMDMRSSFADWDDSRRTKVDIVIKALDHNDSEYVNLELTQKYVDKLASYSKEYKELAPSAKKMVRLHYLQLARTDEEKFKDYQRTLKARAKMEKFKKEGLL